MVSSRAKTSKPQKTDKTQDEISKKESSRGGKDTEIRETIQFGKLDKIAEGKETRSRKGLKRNEVQR